MSGALILGVTLATFHPCPGLHTQTVGVYGVVEGAAVVGVLRNSIGKTSVYAGARIDGPMGTDIVVGGITGYPGAPVFPLVTIGKKWGDVRFQLIPPSSRSAAGVTVSFERRL
jgi:hypothetical protein